MVNGVGIGMWYSVTRGSVDKLVRFKLDEGPTCRIFTRVSKTYIGFSLRKVPGGLHHTEVRIANAPLPPFFN